MVADAVSGVTVLPTHRRRGVLTRMIVPDLAAAAARGVPVAILIAAEAPIYGRFGFGAATETARWSVDVRAAEFAPQVVLDGTVEIVPETELRGIAPAVFEAARRPGAIDQADNWWDRAFGVAGRAGAQAADLARPPLARRKPRTGTRATGRRSRGWTATSGRSCTSETSSTPRPRRTPACGRCSPRSTSSPGSKAPELAVDEPLPWLLTDYRAARQASRQDHQWSRLLDPAAALSARGYECAGAVTFEVVDPQGWAAGTFRLEADADGAGVCTGVEAEPELTLPVDVLSALWLGGGDLHAAALAGLVAEHRRGAVDRLAGLLRTIRAPWTPTWF